MKEETDTNLACDFTAIPEDEREDHTNVTRTITESVEDAEELSEGYPFGLPDSGDIIERIGTFIAGNGSAVRSFAFGLRFHREASRLG